MKNKALSTSCMVVLFALFAIVADVVSAQSGDRIYPKSGRVVVGKIVRMNTRNVSIEVAGGERRFDVNEIRQIVYNGEPRQLGRARTAVADGRYNSAYEELAAITTVPDNKLIQQDVAFYRALCAAKLALSGEQGSVKAAGTGVRQLVLELKEGDNFHYFASVELFGDLAMAVGNFAFAETEYLNLTEVPWEDVAMKGQILVGTAQRRQGKHAEALASFDKVESAQLDTPEAAEMKLLAKVGKAVSLAGTGKTAEGVSLLNSIIYDPSVTNAVVLAKANNALGECYLSSNQSKDAVLAFLHVDLLYSQDRDAHGEALYHLTKLFQELNESQRSAELAAKLRTPRFNNCYWASKK